MDEVSRPVKPEIAEALDGLYSKDEIKAREDASKKKRLAIPKKRIASPDTYIKSDKPKQFSATNRYSGKTYHKKASQQYLAQRVELTSDQKRALALLESGDNVFLTGEAGTGKSFVLNEFLYRNRRKNILVCAPTGIAAINVGGSTLHRVFNAPIGVAKPGDYNSKPDESVVKADIVVIDEISMCRFDLFEYVIRTIKNAEAIRQNDENVEAISNGRMPEIIKPKQIIVVGDFYQLAPVISTRDREALYSYWDRELIGEGFAFMSPIWRELNFKNVIVKEIVRQAGETDYLENLNRIRTGDINGIIWFNNNISRQSIPNGIYLCGTNQKADEINIRESEALPGEARTYSAQIKGSVGPGDKMTMDELTLKIGMQVMTLVNDSNEGFQNGSIGKVAAMESDHVQVRLDTGRLVTVSIHDWEILDYEVQADKLEKVVIGNFKQLPLKIAYAITIHKSQGQTYSSVNISPDCFAPGQLYVALSRAKSAKGMSLEHAITSGALRTSFAVKRFYEELTDINDSIEIPQLSLFDLVDNEPEVSLNEEFNEEQFELPWDDSDLAEDMELPERRSPIYEKVMNMDEETASSCLMYNSIRNHPSAYAAWSKEEDDQLIQEVRQGLNIKQIAEIHQRTNGAISSRIKKLNSHFGLETIVDEISSPIKSTSNLKTDRKRKGRKKEFQLSEKEASMFEYEDSMMVREMKNKLNDLRDEKNVKRVTSKRIFEFLNGIGYVSEKYVDGVWIKVISDEGLNNGVHYIKYKNNLGIEYVGIGLAKQVQKVIVNKFIHGL